jgi:hypothetical protein
LIDQQMDLHILNRQVWDDEILRSVVDRDVGLPDPLQWQWRIRKDKSSGFRIRFCLL